MSQPYGTLTLQSGFNPYEMTVAADTDGADGAMANAAAEPRSRGGSRYRKKQRWRVERGDSESLYRFIYKKETKEEKARSIAREDS